MKNNEKSKQDVAGHKKYIEELHKKSTESFLNSQVDQQAYFFKTESEAAKKFYRMLNHLDD